MSYKTDISRVTGLGSAKEGAHHWWGQRITSVALIPLTIFALCPLIKGLGADHADVLEIYRSPWAAVMTILFLITMFRHLQQGLQVVIEDYIHGKATRTGLLLGNILFCWAFGLAGVFAVAKIAFSA